MGNCHVLAVGEKITNECIKTSRKITIGRIISISESLVFCAIDDYNALFYQNLHELIMSLVCKTDIRFLPLPFYILSYKI